MKRGFRIAVTGGPGGGKTTAIDLFRRELGDESVVVPEAATLLFGGGVPRYTEPNAIRVRELRRGGANRARLSFLPA